MADRKAVNKYYPPAWTPEQGSINKFRGSHPLRDRARKLDQGIMIMRFELPYNIWCGGCGNHIGMGVRYNAEKTTVGKYYSTPIFKFRMKCHLCDNHFEIQTDPKNCEYVVVSGASRKNERWEHTEGETVAVEGATEAQKLADNPMYRLEHDVSDEKKASEEGPRIAKIMAMQKEKIDDFSLNQVLRKSFREKKAELRAQEEAERAVQVRASIAVPLVAESPEDCRRAQGVAFLADSSHGERRRKRRDIRSQPLFGLEETEGRKKARLALMAARAPLQSGGGGVAGPQAGSKLKGQSTSCLRSSLGIRTAGKKTT